jgi:hypothetical protein
LAEQPLAEKPLAEQPLAEQPLAEKPMASPNKPRNVFSKNENSPHGERKIMTG